MKRPLALTLCLALLLAGCGGAPDAGSQKQEVRVYAVPPEQTQALMQTLNQVFETSDKSVVGKVSSPGPGQLVVLAPASLQGSIEASLRTLMKDQPAGAGKPAAAAAGAPLRLTFWSVDAVPVAGDDDASLAALEPALEEARRQLGAVHFELRDQVSGVSSPGQPVDRSWQAAERSGQAPSIRRVQYTLRRNEDALTLTLAFSEQTPVQPPGAPLQYASTGSETTTTVRPGQTLVVTQNPVPDNDPSASVPSTLTRLYLVRVDEVPAG